MAVGVRIHDLPANERPRERLWALGAEALSDRELIALVLRSGSRGESALRLATRLLAQFGSVQRLAAALPEELADFPGVGPAKAASLLAALHLARHVSAADPKPKTIKRPEDLALIAIEALQGARRERVIVLVLDSGNRLRRVVKISEGSIDRSLLPVREIISAVLRSDGRAFAVAHNHPSGDPTPSPEDAQTTQALKEAARATGLRFLEHLVVAGHSWRQASPT